MANFPAALDISNATTEGILKQAHEDTLSAVKQLPGAALVTTLTISVGSVAPIQYAHAIDTEAAAAADDLTHLDTTNIPDGQQVLLHTVDPARVITVKHAATGIGDITLVNGLDFILDDIDKRLLLERRGNTWKEICRSYANDQVAARAFAGLTIGTDVLSPTGDGSGLTGIVSGATDAEKTSILANSFMIMVNGTLTAQNMTDSKADVFNDQTGVDTVGSTNESYDASGHFFTNPGGFNKTLLSYTGGDQTFVVPAGVTSIDVKLWGAAGGSFGDIGGGGGFISGTLATTPAENLTVIVGGGGNGTGDTNAYGGGGQGTTGSFGGGGGGRAAIHRGAGDLATAAGGGGGASGSGRGGGGGGLSGQIGQAGSATGGGGGTQSSGGSGGGTAASGALGAGGNAAGIYSGGGGGGYYGGGGSGDNRGGGGGGSSYTGGLTVVTNTAGSAAYDGVVANAADTDYPGSVGNGVNSVAGQNGYAVLAYTSTAPNMTLISTTMTALSQPSSAFVVLWEENVNVVTLNTDLKVYVSRDGGTTWTVGTLALAATRSVGQYLTATVDLSAQPAGTSMKYKVETLNAKELKIHGVALQWS